MVRAGAGGGAVGLAGNPHPGSIWDWDRSLQAEPCASWSLASSSDKCPQQPQACLWVVGRRLGQPLSRAALFKVGGRRFGCSSWAQPPQCRTRGACDRGRLRGVRITPGLPDADGHKAGVPSSASHLCPRRQGWCLVGRLRLARGPGHWVTCRWGASATVGGLMQAARPLGCSLMVLIETFLSACAAHMLCLCGPPRRNQRPGSWPCLPAASTQPRPGWSARR